MAAEKNEWLDRTGEQKNAAQDFVRRLGVMAMAADEEVAGLRQRLDALEVQKGLINQNIKTIRGEIHGLRSRELSKKVDLRREFYDWVLQEGLTLAEILAEAVDLSIQEEDADLVTIFHQEAQYIAGAQVGQQVAIWKGASGFKVGEVAAAPRLVMNDERTRLGIAIDYQRSGASEEFTQAYTIKELVQSEVHPRQGLRIYWDLRGTFALDEDISDFIAYGKAHGNPMTKPGNKPAQPWPGFRFLI